MDVEYAISSALYNAMLKPIEDIDVILQHKCKAFMAIPRTLEVDPRGSFLKIDEHQLSDYYNVCTIYNIYHYIYNTHMHVYVLQMLTLQSRRDKYDHPAPIIDAYVSQENVADATSCKQGLDSLSTKGIADSIFIPYSNNKNGLDNANGVCLTTVKQTATMYEPVLGDTVKPDTVSHNARVASSPITNLIQA